MGPQIQANKKTKAHKNNNNDNNNKPNEQIHYKTIGSVVIGGFVLSLVVVAQPT